MGAEHGHTHAGGAHADLRVMHDLACLVDHLHLLLGVAVVGEHVDVGDDVIGKLRHEFLHFGGFALREVGILLHQLVHGALAGA